MGESVYGLTVHDVLLEAVGGSAAKRALTSAMAAPHLQSQRIAVGERHYTAIPAYGFANVSGCGNGRDEAGERPAAA